MIFNCLDYNFIVFYNVKYLGDLFGNWSYGELVL